MSFLKAAGLFPFLSPEHHNYPNYYHHRNPRSPYDIDRSPVWYVQKLCHHYCEPVNHPPRFALSVHGVRRVGRFNALALLKSSDAEARLRNARIRILPLCVLRHGRSDELLETRIIPERIEHGIEPEQRGSER